MRQVVNYGLAYTLWAITIVLSLLDAVVVRNAYQLVLAATSWHRYSLSAVDKFMTVFLALLLIFIIIFTEHYYRTGVQQNRLWVRFCRLTTIGLGILALSHIFRVILTRSYGLPDTLGLYVVVGELAGAFLFAWLSYRLGRQYA